MTTRHESFESADSRSNIAPAIDRLSESDRQLARDYLRIGELMAELICRASENLRSAVALVSGSFARAKQVEREGRALLNATGAGAAAAHAALLQKDPSRLQHPVQP